MIETFGPVLLFLVVAFLFGLLPLLIAPLITPRRPDPAKLLPYECGVDSIGPPNIQFNARFYLYALLFAVFDVEAIFIFPWAVSYGGLGLFALIEMAIFVAILLIGFAYAWRKRALEWQ